MTFLFHQDLLILQQQRPNKSLQATATALVSRTGVGNLIVTVAFRSQSPVAVPELGR
jgi:hypothetical protein